MRVRILQLGRKVLEHEGQDGATIAAALEAAGVALGPGMDLRVNSQAAAPDAPLRDGDVVTIIPRIKGGAAIRAGLGEAR